MDSSKISQSLVPSTSQEILVMPMKMEITSIENVDNNSTQGEESRDDEKRYSSGSEGKELVEGEFYDTLDKFPSNEENLKKKPS